MSNLPITKATNVTNFRRSIKKQLDLVVNEHVSLIVTRNDDQNVVVLSETEYANLMRTINNLRYENDLLSSALQVERGEIVKVNIDQLMVNEE